MKKPTLLIISATIRRDLHRPFRRFTKFRVVHAYHDSAYGDLETNDLGSDTRQYQSIAELALLIDELKPDLIQGPEPVASRLMLRAAWVVWQYHRRTGTPYFFPSFENLPLGHKFGPLIGWVMLAALKLYAYDAAWVYVLNEGARRTLQKLGFRNAVMLEPDVVRHQASTGTKTWILDPVSPGANRSRMTNKKLIRANWGNWGIDRSEFFPAGNPPNGRILAKNPNATRSNHPVVLFVGRLSAAKGVDILLAAWEIVYQQKPKAELWLVGPTNLDHGNQPLIDRARSTSGVTLLGSKKQRELPAIFQQAWVTVLLSRTTKQWAEQVGMVNLQSLACGTPVVTTDSGSIREYLTSEKREARSEKLIQDTKHGALIVPENDTSKAAKAILVVLQDPAKRETMGRAGVDWIAQTFDEATAVPALETETFERWKSINHHES